MKGKKKYIVPLLLAGVTASAGIVTTYEQQQYIVQAGEAQIIENIAGAELKLNDGGFEDNYTLGSSIEMPAVTVNGSSLGSTDYEVTYTISRGSTVIDTITGSANMKSFTPAYTGDYSVTIEAKKGQQVVSKIEGLIISVVQPEAVINLPVNSKYVIPAQVKTGETNLKIPVPEVVVTDENGEDKEPLKDKAAIDAGLKVELVTPTTENSVKDITNKYNDTTKTINIDSDLLTTPGTYYIKYKFTNTVGSKQVSIAKLDTRFQVVDSADFKQPENLYIKLSGSVPTEGSVNTDITLPKATVYDSKEATDGINAHLTVKITKLNASGNEEKTFYLEDFTDYKFRPTEEGNYIVSYIADLESLYTDLSTEYTPATIISVIDKTTPDVFATFNYEVEDNKVTKAYTLNGEVSVDENSEIEEILVNRKVDIPTVAVLKDGAEYTTIQLPAIFATDNKYGYGELELNRYVSGNGAGTYTVTEEDNKVSEEIKLYKTGIYEIKYVARELRTDGTTAKEGVARFNIEVVSEKDAKASKDTTVKLNLNVGTSTISDKDIIRFAPSATDTLDDYVEVRSGYQIIKETAGVKTAVPGTKTYLTKLVDGKYVVNVKKDIIDANKYDTNDNTSTYYVRVFAEPTVDSTIKEYRKETPAEKLLKIVDNSKDNAAPTFQVIENFIDNVEKSTYTNGSANSWNKALFNANTDLLINKNGNTDVTVKGINAAGYALSDANDDKSTIVSKEDDKTLLAAFNQNNGFITVPTVKFTDNDENVRFTVTVYNNVGNKVVKANSEEVIRKEVDGKWEHIVTGLQFKTSYADVYTVVFKAEDSAGNVTVTSYGIRLNNTTPPSIDLEDTDKFGMDIEVGEFFEVPTGVLMRGETELEGRDVHWVVTASDGAEFTTQATGFTPLTPGTFYIKYYGTDGLGNYKELSDHSLYFVTAKDTTAPEFNESIDNDIVEVMAWTQDATSMDIEIPVIYATDPIRGGSVDVTCTVKAPDQSKVELRKYDDESKSDLRYFKATKQGLYEIVYTATDSANNTSTITKQIALGDCIEPTITWKNNAEAIFDDTYSLNDIFELKLSDLILKDNETKDTSKMTLKVKLLKPDKTTELTNLGSDKNYKWKLTETGTYTLTITVKDEAGNDTQYTNYINVPAEDTDSKEISPVWGTVLIVASVVILGGVVVYFIVSSRKKSTKKTTRSRKKD